MIKSFTKRQAKEFRKEVCLCHCRKLVDSRNKRMTWEVCRSCPVRRLAKEW